MDSGWTEEPSEDGPVAEVVEEGPIDWNTTTNIKALRERAKRYDESQLHIILLERQSAMLRSEVDLESPIGQYFYKNYTGEYSPEAVRAEAEKHGIPFKGSTG